MEIYSKQAKHSHMGQLNEISLLVMQYAKALKTWNEPPHYDVVGKPPTPCAEIRCKT